MRLSFPQFNSFTEATGKKITLSVHGLQWIILSRQKLLNSVGVKYVFAFILSCKMIIQGFVVESEHNRVWERHGSYADGELVFGCRLIYK